MGDVQEMSFQNVVDTILKPQGIKCGGYPDDLFLDLLESDRDRFQCNICYMIIRDARQCDNKHVFCATCVFAWSMTYGSNSDKCPVCRSKQQDYMKHNKLDSELEYKWVKCPEPGCALRCPLRDFLQHSHGMKLYGQSVDLNTLRRSRPAPVNPMSGGILFLPTLRTNGTMGNVREGRNLLQDMMLVLHLEMELRRRAIERLASEQNDTERARHMSEVLAIQEQMHEITGFLNLLFSVPPNFRQAGERPTIEMTRPHIADDESDSDSASSTSSDSSGVISRYRIAERQRLQQRTSQLGSQSRTAAETSITPLTATSHLESRPLSTIRAARRSEIREELARIEPTPATQQLQAGRTIETSRREERNATEPEADNSLTGVTRSILAPNSISRATLNGGRMLSSRPQLGETRAPNTEQRSNDIIVPTSFDVRTRTTENRPTNNTNRAELQRNSASVGTTQSTSTNNISTPSASEATITADANTDLPQPAVLPGSVTRASSTFQRAMEHLPPIEAGQPSTRRTSDPPSAPAITESSVEPAAEPAPPRSRPGPASIRRPAPPTGGRAVNTTRLRRSISVQQSPANPPTQRQRPTRTRGQSEGGLPATPGQLMRARRRSEIHKEIAEKLSENNP